MRAAAKLMLQPGARRPRAGAHVVEPMLRLGDGGMSHRAHGLVSTGQGRRASTQLDASGFREDWQWITTTFAA